MNQVTAGALWFQVAGVAQCLTPRAARAASADFRVLSATEVLALEALGETLLPGAREAGIAHFVDSQLAADPAESLLMIRYLDVPPPYVGFYRPVLAALDAAARAAHGQAFNELGSSAADAMVEQMSRENPNGWQGPAGGIRVLCAAKRCGRRRVRNDGGIREAGYPVHAAHRAA